MGSIYDDDDNTNEDMLTAEIFEEEPLRNLLLSENDEDILRREMELELNNSDIDTDNLDEPIIVPMQEMTRYPYPRMIEDPNAGFPAIHEIGETIDEMHLIMQAYVLNYCINI